MGMHFELLEEVVAINDKFKIRIYADGSISMATTSSSGESQYFQYAEELEEICLALRAKHFPVSDDDDQYFQGGAD